jgi:alpha-tocopherol transfer protein
LNEDHERNKKIKQLRSLLSGCELSHRGREDDAFLLRFLRAKKFDVDKAFKMMTKYYWMKDNLPELFKVSPPSSLKSMLELQIQCMTPQKDNHGRQIYIFRVGKLNLTK